MRASEIASKIAALSPLAAKLSHLGVTQLLGGSF
jgi:hypothetical protein